MNQSSEASAAIASSPTSSDRWCYCFVLPIVGLGLVTAWLFYPFTAEDAYITARYAENLVDTGEFVYNEGERVSAMTSPLHALLEAGLYFVTGQTLVSYKIIGLLCYLGSVLVVAGRYRREPYPLVVCLLLLVAAPCMIEWTFGGLETPLLMLLVTLATVLSVSPEKISTSRLCFIALLAGLGFVTRYDSVIYLVPLSIYAANKSRSPRAIGLAILCGAALPAAWLVFSHWYYGDILPTSAYVKAPKKETYFLKVNAVYVVEYLFQLGIIPLLGLLFWVSPAKRQFVHHLRPAVQANWGSWLGIALLLLYGVAIATTHMMFAFRYFVPYLPATALLLAEIFRREVTRLNEQQLLRRLRIGFAVLVPMLIAYAAVQVRHTYLYSVDGLIFPIGDRIIGEYKDEGLKHYYSEFMPLLAQQAKEIETHWQTLPQAKERSFRLHTYIGGIVPYLLRDAYIYEQLVAYRHVGRYNTRVSADYIQMLVPRLGRLEVQLPGRVGDYELISSHRLKFDDAVQDFCVYYNPHPEEHRLPARIDGKE